MSTGTGRALVRGGIVRVVSSLLQMTIGFLMMPFMISSLGNQQYGLYVAAGGFVANFYLLDLGFSTAVMRNVAVGFGREDHELVNRTISTGLAIYSALGLGVLVLTASAAASVPSFVSDPSDARATAIVVALSGLSLALGFPFKAVAGILQAKVRYDLMAITQMVIASATALATVWALSSDRGIVAVSLISFLASQTTNVAFLLICRRLFPQMNVQLRNVHLADVKELASYSAWAFLIQLGNQVRFRVDSLVIGYLFSAAAVTPYYVGVRLQEYVSQLLYQATNMATPVLTSMHGAQDRDRLRAAVLFLFRLNLTFAVYGAGMVWIFADLFLRLWMGADYGESASVARVLVTAGMLEFAVGPIISGVYAFGTFKPLALATAVEGAVNLGASFWLGRQLGLLGVAYGTLLPLAVIRISVVTPWAASLAGIRIPELLIAAWRPLLVSLTTMGALGGLTALRAASGLGRQRGLILLAGAATVVTLVYWPLVLNIGLTRSERHRLASGAPQSVTGLVRLVLRG